MVVVRSSRFSPLGWWHARTTARVHGLPVPRQVVSPLDWWRARAMARSAGLPVRRYKMADVSLGGVQYKIKLMDSTPDWPLVWWLDGDYKLRLTIQRSPDTPSGLRRTLVWGADLNTSPRGATVTHATAEAAAADLMDRYSTSEAEDAFELDRFLNIGDARLTAAFAEAARKHLGKRANAVPRETEAEELRPPTDG
jgi:hypothetical protein